MWVTGHHQKKQHLCHVHPRRMQGQETHKSNVCCAQLLSQVWLFANPWTAAHQAPLSMGFSRPEHRSYHALLQGIFPTQGSHPGLPHCRQILYHLSCQGSPQKAILLKNKERNGHLDSWGPKDTKYQQSDPNSSKSQWQKRLFKASWESNMLHLRELP